MRTPDRRPGFTLVELILAVFLVSLLIVALLNAFGTTQRFAATGEAQFNSVLLAQLVTERIKSTLAMNPRALRDLMGGNPDWKFTGTVVDPASAVNPAGLKLSPFFQFLFSRDGTDLCAPANQVSIAPASAITTAGIKPREMQALLESFRDHQVTVEIADDAPLEPPGSPRALPAEMLKRVAVTVARTSVIAAKGEDPLAYTLTARVQTPADSLSAPALDTLDRRFEGPTLQVLWDGFFLTIGDNPFFLPTVLTPADKNLLADIFLVLAGANNEDLEIEGNCVLDSVIVGAASSPPPDFIDAWIAKMTQPGVYDLSSSKREVAHLRIRKTSVIFDTFKRIRLPLEDFNERLIGPITGPAVQPCLRDRVLVLTAQLASLLRADSLGGMASFLSQNRASIILCTLLDQFFNEPNYKDVAVRPSLYAARFHQSLEDLKATLEDHLDQADGVTGYERMRSAQTYYEVTVARAVEAGAPDPAALARLQRLAGQYASKQADLSRYLGGGEAFDGPQLLLRNKAYATRIGDLKADSPRYAQATSLFQSGGVIADFLALCHTASTKGGPEISKVLSQLNGVLNQ